MTTTRAHIGERPVKNVRKQKQGKNVNPGLCSGLGSKKCSCFGGKETCSRIGAKCEVLHPKATVPVIIA